MDKKKKLKINAKKILRVILKAIFFTFILGGVLTSIFGWTIVDPIIQRIMPSKISICPYPYPQLHDGKQWIRVNIANDGLPEINHLDVEYKLCNMKEYSKAIMHYTALGRGQSDYFEIESKLNMNCSYITNPLTIELYEDKQKRCYLRINDSSTDVCTYCYLYVNVYEGNKLLRELKYAFPFFENNVNLTTVSEGECLRYDQAENASELVRNPQSPVGVTVVDISTACIRGEWNKTWCKENGYEVITC